MPQIAKRAKDKKEKEQLVDSSKRDSMPAAVVPTPTASPMPEIGLESQEADPSKKKSNGEESDAKEGSTADASVSQASYPYHDALEHFPRGEAANAACAQISALDASAMLPGILSKEYAAIEEREDIVGYTTHVEVLAMSAAAALVGEKIPGLENVQVPELTAPEFDVDPGLAELEGIIKRAKPTFADAIDEFSVDVQLNTISEGDI